MNATPWWALSALLLGLSLSARAQDEIVLGSPLPAAPGEFARVPVFLRDVPGTLLGAGGIPIQLIDLSITHSHPHFIAGCLGTTYPNCNLQFHTAGALADSPPTSRTLINIASLYARLTFDEPPLFTGGLDSIGFITLRIDPAAPPGAEIRLELDPTKTFLADRSGIIADRELKLIGATLSVARCPDLALPGTPSFDFLGQLSGCSSVSGVCRVGEDVEFFVTNPTDLCDTVTWSFGDGTSATNVSTVRHRFTPPTLSPTLTSVTYSVTATATRTSGTAVFSRAVSIEAEAETTECP
jgi:hypothetical protein